MDLMDKETLRNTAFPEQDDALFNKKVTPVAVPQHEIGIDLDNRVLDNIVDTMETSQFDINALNSFTQVSRSRNDIYDTLDDMGDDSIIAAVLETYAEDATERNDDGLIVWAESDDAEVAKMVEYLLDTLNVDKQAKEVIINFWRSYNEWYHPKETNNIFCADMDLITGRGIEGFAVPYMWPTVPFGYLFSTGIDDFIPCYKKSAKKLGASRMKDIMITYDKDNLNVRLFY